MSVAVRRRAALQAAREVAKSRDCQQGIVHVPMESMVRLQVALQRLSEEELERRMKALNAPSAETKER